MPFTFAHPAAVIPLRGMLDRFGVMSALVIGSLAPDIPHFLPENFLYRGNSHSFWGLLWFCMPVGCICYLLYHLVFKAPLLSLLPMRIVERLDITDFRLGALPASPLTAVLLSLYTGAVTHVVWDAFTHEYAPGVMLVPVLRTRLFDIGQFHVHVYNVLQHFSTAIGLALLSFWSWRWLLRSPVRQHAMPATISVFEQRIAVGGILGLSLIVALWAGFHAINHRTGVFALRVFMRRAIFTGVPAAVLALTVYCAFWHLRRLSHSRHGS